MGVWVDELLDWKAHVSDRTLKIKCNKNMLQQSKNVLDSHSKKLIYFGHIHSHLTYGLVNWGSLITNRDLDKLQKLQNQCVRLIDPKSNINQIYKKNQILKIKDLIKLELSKFGYKYLHNILPT